jgi:dihydrodipicolinate synthase/N-acetylneuraminate lyase
VQANKLREAEKLYYKMLPLLMYLEAGQLGAKVKAAMTLIGQCGGSPRTLFLPLAKEEKPALQKVLKDLGVL